jgi:hypothetical protein
VVVLGSLTFFVYLIYWAFKTWRLLKNEAADENRLEAHPALSLFKNVSPGLRTLALVSPLLIGAIPFIAPFLKALVSDVILIWILGTLAVGLAALVPDEKSFAKKHPLLSCGLILGFGFIMAGTAKQNNALFLIAPVGAAVACAFMQHWLNKYWATVEPEGLLVRHGFNFWELAAIICGGGLMGFDIAGMMIGVKPH